MDLHFITKVGNGWVAGRVAGSVVYPARASWSFSAETSVAKLEILDKGSYRVSQRTVVAFCKCSPIL